MWIELNQIFWVLGVDNPKELANDREFAVWRSDGP